MDSPNPFNSKSFKALKAKWDQKLKDSKFNDVEDSEGRLKHWSSDVFRRRPEYDQSKAEYHRAAGKFLYDYKFANDFEKTIWALHANGKSIREISKLLSKRGTKADRDKVQKNLKRLAKIMVDNARNGAEQD